MPGGLDLASQQLRGLEQALSLPGPQFPHRKGWITNTSQYFLQVIMRIKWTFSEIIKWKALLFLNLERKLLDFCSEFFPMTSCFSLWKIWLRRFLLRNLIHSLIQSIHQQKFPEHLQCAKTLCQAPGIKAEWDTIQSKSGQKILTDVSPKKTHRWPISNEKILHITY